MRHAASVEARPCRVPAPPARNDQGAPDDCGPPARPGGARGYPLASYDLERLELDNVFATHALPPAEEARFRRIYGFVHFRRGSYQRAIDAYEASVRLSEESGSADPLSLITIARIHYRRHEYQPALDYAVEYLKAINQPRPADYVFVDRLRQLGTTVQ